MKWLLLVAGTIAAFLAARLLLSDIRRMGGRATLGSLAGAAVSLAALAGSLYVAHYLGWFSVAFVALAFVPFGLAARWSLLASRRRRDGYEATRLPTTETARERVLRPLTLVLLVALMAGVAMLGAAAAVVASWR